MDELIVTDSDFNDRELLEIVSHAHRKGVQVRIAPRTTELLTQRVEFVPGQGVPLFELRPPAFVGIDWFVKRGFDLAVSGLVLLVGLPLWLGIAAARQADLARPGASSATGASASASRSSGCSSSARCTRTRRSRQAELEAANEADGRALQDPRRPAGDARRRGSCAGFSLDEIPQL